MRHKLRVANIRHCRYCIPIRQAAQLSRADPGVSRAFLLILDLNEPRAVAVLAFAETLFHKLELSDYRG